MESAVQKSSGVSTVDGGKLYETLRRLISVVDDLRDVGLQEYINLPRIVVVGTQSGGKSSILESIVGLDFLPRGDGVVTRCPLELRLVHIHPSEVGHGSHHGSSGVGSPSGSSSASSNAGDAYAIFARNPTKKYYNFAEVKDEIARMTEAMAGKNKGIVDEPIVLNIYSSTCPDLSMIDLPGVTRVPLKGTDQRDDIEKITKDMSMKYISDPRTIILAVIPANQDMSTSDALQMARNADPTGNRTIGVLTKIDIMDPGTDAIKMLRGEEIGLKLGFVGVRNRGQADIRNNKGVRSALEEEKKWFMDHPKYSKLPPGFVGTDALIDKLSRVLFRQIRHFLPSIKKDILERRRKVDERLGELGSGVPVEVSDQIQLMWTMVNDYCDMMRSTIKGKYDKRLQSYGGETGELKVSGGSQIRAILNEFLVEWEDARITQGMDDDAIESAIRMHEGDSLPGFPSMDIFEFLIQPHLLKVTQPSVDCLGSVLSVLENLSQKICRMVFRRFPSLSDQVLDLSVEIFRREKEVTRSIIESIVNFETGYLFTNDLSYLTQHGSMQKMYPTAPGAVPGAPAVVTGTVMGPAGGQISLGATANPQAAHPTAQQQQQQQQLLAQQQAQQQLLLQQQQQQAMQPNAMGARGKGRYNNTYIAEIRSRIDAYFAIVIRSVRDSVPKAIGYFLVRKVLDKLQFEIYNALNRQEDMSNLLGEPPHIVEERKQLVHQRHILDKSNNILQRDPTICNLSMDAMDSAIEENMPGTNRGLSSSSAVKTSGLSAASAAASLPIPSASSAGAMGSAGQSSAPSRGFSFNPFGGNSSSSAAQQQPVQSNPSLRSALQSERNPLFD